MRSLCPIPTWNNANQTGPSSLNLCSLTMNSGGGTLHHLNIRLNLKPMEDLERCLSNRWKTVHPSHHCTSNHGMGQMALRRRALQSLTDAEKEERRKLLNRECQRRFRERRLLRANQTKNKSSRAYTSHPQFSNLKSSRHDSWQ